MSCDFCCATGVADGVERVACVWFYRLRRLGANEYSEFLYQCPQCGAYWEKSAWHPDTPELTLVAARAQFPSLFDTIGEA